jgi:hypothetical protein
VKKCQKNLSNILAYIHIFQCHKDEPYNERNAFLVLRSQLAKTNPFYPSSPAPEDIAERKAWKTELKVENFCTVCRACGCSVAGGEGGQCAACRKGFRILNFIYR